MTENRKKLVELKNVSLTFNEGKKNEVKAIDNISFDIYEGEVVRIMNFGAFVQLSPNKDGMIHISKLSNERVEKVEDVVNIGDKVAVKVLEIDKMGRINLKLEEKIED